MELSLFTAIIIIGAFILGSLPFGVWIGQAYGVNVMELGSKNIGATNVWRTAGKIPGLMVLLLDIAKGYIPAIIAAKFMQGDWGLQEKSIVVGFVAVIGHTASPFLRFKGGKGVATALGALLGATPLIAGICFGVFLLLLLITRYVSLSSLIAAFFAPVIALYLQSSLFVVITYSVVFLYLLMKHKTNITRLLSGSESKFFK